MIPVVRIAELGAALGSAEGLAKVNAAIELLNRDLMHSDATFSRDELAQTLRALSSLSAVILCMDRVASAILAHSGGGVVNCVG
jgi:hypothetical protein